MVLHDNVTKKISAFWRYALAIGLITVLFFLSIISLPFTPLAHLKIPFFFMALFYWALHRPRLMPPWSIFICGFLIDVIGGYPLGLNAFLYVAVQALMINQRRYLLAQNFFIIWGIFAAVLSAIYTSHWFLFSVLGDRINTFMPLAITTGLGIAIFPLVAFILSRVHKILPSTSSSHMFKV